MSQTSRSSISPESRPWFRGLIQNSSSKKLQEDGSTPPDDGSPKTSRQSSQTSLNSLRTRCEGDIAAIFVHAGAGFHSVQNERIHLKACDDACRVAVNFLRNGGSAVDAVEAAIKVLEDNEVTNAGYGSNLAMDGVVECDATIVDHYGRSGAVGAIRGRSSGTRLTILTCLGVLNPIHVARKVLDESTKPLSLKRVPPNLLVGQGALDFAYRSGIPTLPADAMVSPGALERYYKWTRDLNAAGERPAQSVDSREIAGLRNEAQPGSPLLSSWQTHEDRTSMAPSSTAIPLSLSPASSRSPSIHNFPARMRSPLASDSPSGRQSSFRPSPRRTEAVQRSEEGIAEASQGGNGRSPPDSASSSTLVAESEGRNQPTQADGDNIVDTVGAIAIDCNGNIAAGSSSGGIGLKHRGRMGPAALVGIGTAVVPARSSDKSQMTTACVTSGTGEHMATTTAASTCAERVHANQKRGSSGSLEFTHEDQAMRSFIIDEFMSHPSLQKSHSAGAIGVMVVKKSADGLYLYFGHNTESFALASMSAEEEEPRLQMSRIKKSEQCTTGARKIRWVSPASSKIRDCKKRQAPGSPSRTQSVDSLAKKARSPSKASHLCRAIDGVYESIPMLDGADDDTSEKNNMSPETATYGAGAPAAEKRQASARGESANTPPETSDRPKADHETRDRLETDRTTSITPTEIHNGLEAEGPKQQKGATDALLLPDAKALQNKPVGWPATSQASVPSQFSAGRSVRLQQSRVARLERCVARWSRSVDNRRLMLEYANALVQQIDARIAREKAPPRLAPWGRPKTPQREDGEAFEYYVIARARLASHEAHKALAQARLAKARARLLWAEQGLCLGFPRGVVIPEAEVLRIEAREHWNEARRQARLARFAPRLPPTDVSAVTQSYANALVARNRRKRGLKRATQHIAGGWALRVVFRSKVL